MCGIVGYLGPENPKKVILEGLRALEYRGYDSAGVAILHKGRFKRIRAEGKLGVLAAKLQNEEFDGHLGIGHTRWATHGAPTERNAHPHCVEGVSIVHNGIIENYAELKEELVAHGAQFESETDSELVAHLIAQRLRLRHDLLSAVLDVVPRLQGAYAILVVSQDQPDQLVAFKNGPPLVVGQTASEIFIASDIQAIIPHTKNILYINDNEILAVKGSHVEILSRSGAPVKRHFALIQWDSEKAEKSGFDHFMLKEIFEQPRSVAQAIAPHIDLHHQTVLLKGLGFGVALNDLDKMDMAADWIQTQKVLQKVDRVFFIACGTSYYAALCGKYLIEKLAGIPTECDFASEFRYREPVLSASTLVIAISQSGETADTLAALRLAKERGLRTMSLCNVRRSTLDRDAEAHLYMNAGLEIGVASTKAFSSTLAVLHVLALALGRIKNHLTLEAEQALVRELLAVPSHMETVLAHDKFFREAAEHLKSYKGFLYMGRGIHYPVALEGALKLKELAYMHAEGYAAGEMKHGPLALVDKDMAIVTLAPHDDLYEKTMSNLEEAKARGGQILSIGTGFDERLKKLSLHYLSLPETSWSTLPLLEVVPLQLLAYHLATSLGHDVDQPRNLAKSVTVE